MHFYTFVHTSHCIKYIHLICWTVCCTLPSVCFLTFFNMLKTSFSIKNEVWKVKKQVGLALIQYLIKPYRFTREYYCILTYFNCLWFIFPISSAVHKKLYCLFASGTGCRCTVWTSPPTCWVLPRSTGSRANLMWSTGKQSKYILM